MDDLNDLGNKLALFIRNCREKRGLTQENLANIVSVSEITINRIEAGNVDLKLSVLEKICKAFDLSITEVFHEIENSHWRGEIKMSDGEKALIVMQNMKAQSRLPAHWTTVEADFESFYGYKPRDFNQILADLSHAKYCNNYPSIGKPVFKRTARGTYDLI